MCKECYDMLPSGIYNKDIFLQIWHVVDGEWVYVAPEDSFFIRNILAEDSLQFKEINLNEDGIIKK